LLFLEATSEKNIERTIANNIITMLQPFEKKFNEIFEKESFTAEEGARHERPPMPKEKAVKMRSSTSTRPQKTTTVTVEP